MTACELYHDLQQDNLASYRRRFISSGQNLKALQLSLWPVTGDLTACWDAESVRVTNNWHVRVCAKNHRQRRWHAETAENTAAEWQPIEWMRQTDQLIHSGTESPGGCQRSTCISGHEWDVLSKRKRLLVAAFCGKLMVESKDHLSASWWGSTHSRGPLEKFFCCLKKILFHQGRRVQRARLWKETTITFPTHFCREQKNFGTCRMCITERCQNWNAIGAPDKGEAAMRDRFRERRAGLPTADGRFIVNAGGEGSPRREEWDHKKG